MQIYFKTHMGITAVAPPYSLKLLINADYDVDECDEGRVVTGKSLHVSTFDSPIPQRIFQFGGCGFLSVLENIEQESDEELRAEQREVPFYVPFGSHTIVPFADKCFAEVLRQIQEASEQDKPAVWIDLVAIDDEIRTSLPNINPLMLDDAD